MKINKHVCDSCGKEGEEYLPKNWVALSIYKRKANEAISLEVLRCHICPDCDFKREITVFKKEK